MRVLEGLHPARAARHVRAEIGDALDPQRQEASVRVQGESRFGLVVTRLMVGEKHLAAGRDPLDRPAHAACGPRHEREFRDR